MAITLNPSEQVVKQSVVEASVEDSTGRVIKVKKPKPLDRLGLIAALGNELSSNSMYFSQVFATICVSEIDGEAVLAPLSLREVQAIYQRLDDHGLLAVQEWLVSTLSSDPEKDKDAVKK